MHTLDTEDLEALDDPGKKPCCDPTALPLPSFSLLVFAFLLVPILMLLTSFSCGAVLMSVCRVSSPFVMFGAGVMRVAECKILVAKETNANEAQCTKECREDVDHMSRDGAGRRLEFLGRMVVRV